MLVDQNTERTFIPLNHMHRHFGEINTGKLEIANSSLSEFAVLGFEVCSSCELLIFFDAASTAFRLRIHAAYVSGRLSSVIFLTARKLLSTHSLPVERPNGRNKVVLCCFSLMDMMVVVPSTAALASSDSFR